MLRKYRWPGNIRQLKNVAETISALESARLSGYSDKCTIDVDVLSRYIPKEEPNLLPAKSSPYQEQETQGEREAIIRMLLQLKQDVDYLKDIVAKAGLGCKGAPVIAPPDNLGLPQMNLDSWDEPVRDVMEPDEDPEEQDYDDRGPEDMSIKSANMDLIEKVLRKHDGNRKAAAAELGISERTLYRKIKQMTEK
jgi:transcriptional regulator with PAS, ATPase and Fis domain